ncbi:MAG: imelysin family protein [Saprospiraceae bacterium]|nr:imelysin family protein [Saprospiraceae bacterium]
MNRIPLILTLFLIGAFVSCGENEPDGPSEPTNSFDRKSLLINAADGIIIPALEDYVSKVEILNSAANSFILDPTLEGMDLLQGFWLDAYSRWQYVSMFNIGKAEEISLRNFTNIYPTNTTEIEQNIISGDYNLELPSKNDEQGFPALDYMLFGIDVDKSAIVSKYSESPYASYLTDLTQRLEELSSQVLEDWKNGYREEFINNDGTSATSSLNKMVNDYLFYYEKFLRAGKIGIPAGVFSGDPLTDKVEAFYAKDVSKTLFLEGLSATKRFFNGTNYETDAVGTGLKSYLDYLNTIKEGEDLSQLINEQFDSAQAQAQGLDENFVNQIENDNISMLATYDELQKNVILLKVDMLQALNIKVDFVDADGD